MWYCHWNIPRGDSGQDIWYQDHRRTWTCTWWLISQPQTECSRILHCCPNSRCAPLFSWDIVAEIFPEGTRDKIFDNEIVAALGCELDSRARISAVELFTAALAQGVVLGFLGILTLKYFQRGLGTRYLIPRSSPHLDVHLVAQIPAPAAVQSKSSLLP